MANQPTNWKRHLVESLLLFLAGLCTNLIFCPKCLANLAYTWDDFLFSGLLWILLWKGNELMAEVPDRYISWKEHPVKRLMIGITVHILYTIIASTFVYQFVSFLEHGKFLPFGMQKVLDTNFFAVVITIIIMLFMTARSFLFAWRDLAVAHEQLKAESIASRLASLQAQVNPHFLFNSLNVLSGLVYRDADLSAQFIKKLSEVYRYVLDRQEEELVSIAQEMEFVHAIVFLQRIRFGEHLHVDIEIPEDRSFYLAPLALQMLIENAIKHNVISAAQPLYIRIYLEPDYLVVSNNLQPKKTLSDSLGIGLENIRKRYNFLTNKAVVVEKGQEQFSVKLPIIETA